MEKPKKEKLKCWIIVDAEDMGHAVISESKEKAELHIIQKIGWEESMIEEIRLEKQVKILPEDYEGKILETDEGLLRGAYTTSGDAETDCKVCGESSEWCEVIDGKIMCPKCLDKLCPLVKK